MSSVGILGQRHVDLHEVLAFIGPALDLACHSDNLPDDGRRLRAAALIGVYPLTDGRHVPLGTRERMPR